MSPGKIILLNGASSSGKTTLLKALQALMDEPYLDAGIDKFIWMLPERYLNRPLWDEVLGLATEAGAWGHRLVAGMHRAIAALSENGNNVIADHVLVDPRWVKELAEFLSDLPAYLVGIRCPLKVLEAREEKREDRTLGQARAQHALVHAHGTYDLEVDTSRLSVQDCALKIKKLVEDGRPPMVLKRLRARAAG